MGAVHTLIVFENLEIMRYEVHNRETDETSILFLTPEQQKDASHFHDKKTGKDLDVKDEQSLLEWFTENYKKFGTQLEFISDRSQEGSQFLRGFGGIGGLLRWKVDFANAVEESESEGDDDEDDDDSDIDLADMEALF